MNKWKPKWVHVGYSWSQKKRKKKNKTPKRPKWSSKSQEDTLIKVNGQQCRQYSVLPQSDLLFPLRTLQGSVSVRLIKVSTNQCTIGGGSTWRSLIIFGCSKSCLDLIVLNARTVKGRQRRWNKNLRRKERKGDNDYFNLVFT